MSYHPVTIRLPLRQQRSAVKFPHARRASAFTNKLFRMASLNAAALALHKICQLPKAWRLERRSPPFSRDLWSYWCIYLSIYLCIYLSIYLPIYIYMTIHILYKYIIHIYLYICMIYIYICLRVCMYACKYVSID